MAEPGHQLFPHSAPVKLYASVRALTLTLTRTDRPDAEEKCQDKTSASDPSANIYTAPTDFTALILRFCRNIGDGHFRGPPAGGTVLCAEGVTVLSASVCLPQTATVLSKYRTTIERMIFDLILSLLLSFWFAVFSLILKSFRTDLLFQRSLYHSP